MIFLVKIYESAKVFVFDFHFNSTSKQAIAEKKKELSEYFNNLRDLLEDQHEGTAVEDIFLREH